MLAGQSPSAQSDAALEQLCRTYWYPLYAFVRRKGYSAHEAQDLTQGFFARLLEKKSIQAATPERGRFRSFLLKSLNHFLINDWARKQTGKRGGGLETLSLDEEVAERSYSAEPAGRLEPEALYDRRWALTLLERAMERLGDDYASNGRRSLFERLRPSLLSEAPHELYSELAREFGLNEGAARVALHRLRQRFRDVVRAEVAKTVATPDEVEEELRYLLAALNG